MWYQGRNSDYPKRNLTLMQGKIKFKDKGFVVVPRQFTGRLLHDFKPAETPQGDVYCEIYLNEPGSVNRVGLYRRGTRVLPSLTELDHFQKEPWPAGFF